MRITPSDMVAYAGLGAMLSFLFAAPLLHQWRRKGKVLIFPPKIAGLLGPFALLCLFVFLGFDTVKHWTGKPNDWLWVLLPVPAALLFLRVASPWTVRIEGKGIRTRTWFGRKKFIAWDDIGAVTLYRTSGRYASSGCEIFLHGGETLSWDDHFQDSAALAEVIAKRTRIPLEFTQK